MPSIHNNLKMQPFKTNTKLQQITKRLKHLIYIIQFGGMTDIKKITTVILGGRKAGTHKNPPNISFLTVKRNTFWDWGGATVLSQLMEGRIFVSQEP